MNGLNLYNRIEHTQATAVHLVIYILLLLVTGVAYQCVIPVMWSSQDHSV